MKEYRITEALLDEAIGGLKVYGKVAVADTVARLEKLRYGNYSISVYTTICKKCDMEISNMNSREHPTWGSLCGWCYDVVNRHGTKPYEPK